MNNKKSTGSIVFWMEPLFPPKRGDAVGKTKVGKGTKVMMVTDGNGLPLSIHIASAQPHEIRLPTLWQTKNTTEDPHCRPCLRQSGFSKEPAKTWHPILHSYPKKSKKQV
jgi:hypothetical protein